MNINSKFIKLTEDIININTKLNEIVAELERHEVNDKKQIELKKHLIEGLKRFIQDFMRIHILIMISEFFLVGMSDNNLDINNLKEGNKDEGMADEK